MRFLFIGLLSMVYTFSLSAQIPLLFSTTRLYAEKATQEHESYLAEILTSDEVQQAYNTTDNAIFINIEAQMRIITDQWEQWGYGLYILFDIDKKFVGFAGFHTITIENDATIQCFDHNHSLYDIEFYLFLMPYAWRKGYGYEIGTKLIELAFAYLPCTSVVAYIEPKNVASQNLIEKLRFKKEKSVMYNDKPHVLYRVLKGT
jgi:RimJ/RimL family protein N-acetyltransferase